MLMGSDLPRNTGVWSSAFAYESYVGRWSRQVAQEFVRWLAVPAPSRWLDVGCGSGALARTIIDVALPGTVTALDRSSAYVAYAQHYARIGQADFVVGDAQRLPFKDATFDVAVSGLMLNFVPDAALAVAEMARMVCDGGTVALYVWDYAGEMQFIRYFWDAAAELFPSARDYDEGVRFTLCRPEPLAELFLSAGLYDIEGRAIDIPTIFRDFDDYWSPFLGGQGPAPGYVASLTVEERAELREYLRRELPAVRDGSIHLIARAWAMRGRRPDTG